MTDSVAPNEQITELLRECDAIRELLGPDISFDPIFSKSAFYPEASLVYTTLGAKNQKRAHTHYETLPLCEKEYITAKEFILHHLELIKKLCSTHKFKIGESCQQDLTAYIQNLSSWRKNHLEVAVNAQRFDNTLKAIPGYRVDPHVKIKPEILLRFLMISENIQSVLISNITDVPTELSNNLTSLEETFNTLSKSITNFSDEINPYIKDKKTVVDTLKNLLSVKSYIDSWYETTENLRQKSEKINTIVTNCETSEHTISQYESDYQSKLTQQTDLSSDLERQLTITKRLNNICLALMEQCDKTLNNSISTVLAQGFKNNADALHEQGIKWTQYLVYCILAISVWSALHVNSGSFLTFLTMELPCIPLLWLAWMFTRQATTAFRLEKDYSFKASAASAYPQYKKEAFNDPELKKQVLNSVLKRFDEHPLSFITPDVISTPLKDILESIHLLGPKSFGDFLSSLDTDKQEAVLSFLLEAAKNQKPVSSDNKSVPENASQFKSTKSFNPENTDEASSQAAMHNPFNIAADMENIPDLAPDAIQKKLTDLEQSISAKKKEKQDTHDVENSSTNASESSRE